MVIDARVRAVIAGTLSGASPNRATFSDGLSSTSAVRR
jgi:hypothetical protein